MGFKAELTLAVEDRHISTDVLILTAHLFCYAVDLSVIRFDISEFSLTCFLFGVPNFTLRKLFSRIVHGFSRNVGLIVQFLPLKGLFKNINTLNLMSSTPLPPQITF